MKINLWKRVAAVGMALGMLFTSMPVMAIDEEAFVEEDFNIVTENETETVITSGAGGDDEDIFDNDLFAEVDESEIEDELVLGITSEETEIELQAAASTTTGTCGDNLTWTLDDNGTLTISGTGEMWNYSSTGNANYTYEHLWNNDSVKTVIIENGVTTIGDYAFYKCSSLTSMRIPDGVTSIGYGVFSGCSSLTNVTIPDSVTSIGQQAFFNCSSLTSVTIPDSMTSISGETFSYCSSLASVTIPYSVTSIGDSVFKGCSSLASVTIPDSVTYIGGNAFHGCSSLTSVRIPSGVTSIRYGVFSGCSRLTSVTIPDSVTSIESYAFCNCSSLTSVTIPGSVTSIGKESFCRCSSLTNVTIPDSVTSIMESAFEDCSSLTNVTIPDSVTSIGQQAFCRCSSLTSVTIPDSMTSISGETFSYCSSLASVTIPYSVTSIGEYAFSSCSSLTSVTIPDSVTSIGGGVFYNCSNLTSVTIPDGVAKIYSNTFSGCSSLTRVTIPYSVTYIGVAAFANCSSLKSVTIPYSVTSIDDSVFKGCSNLTSVTIPASVTSIGDKTFSGCSSLTSVTIPDSVTSIGYDAFSGCSSLTSVTIPDGVTEIYLGTFSGCSSLTRVTIPDSVTSIGGDAFSDCSSLTSVRIPDGVTSIGDGVFSGCSSLTSVTIPSGVTSIGEYAFSSCSSLTSVTIPESVTSIGGGAFNNCSNLTSVTIPSGVTSIGDYAFNKCSSLASVTIPDSVTSIGGGAFNNCSNLTSVTIPSGVTTIERATFSGCSSLTSVTILYTVTSIRGYAFYGCKGLTDVYYTGSEAEWAAIQIEEENDPLLSAFFHYEDTRLEIEFKDGKDTYIYKGMAVIPDVVVRGYKKSEDGSEEEVEVTKGVDYTLTYKDNDIENPGTETVTATVTANGLGDFEGRNAVKAFTIQYKEIYLAYLEVDFGGNVTVHWCFNGAEDAISGFEVQHSWKDTVNDPNGWRTTKVYGSDKREVDIVDLSYNTYEFRVRAVSKEAEDGASEWTDWAECPVKEIKILSPEAGTTYADSYACSAELDFGTEIKSETGTISLYDNNNKLNSWEIGENQSTSLIKYDFTRYFESVTDPRASSPNSFLRPGTTYHIAVDEKSIEYVMGDSESYPVPVYFAGINATDNTTWKFTTVSTSYPGIKNYVDTIDNKYVYELFKEQHAKLLIDDLLCGDVARCWGLSYLVGAYKNKFEYIMSIASKSGGYDNLGQVPINKGSLLSQYVDIAHIYQFRPEYYENTTNLTDLYNAIKSGKNLVITLKSSNNNELHTVFPIGIIDDSDQSNIKIAIYDSACRYLASTVFYGQIRSFVQTAELNLLSGSGKFKYIDGYNFDYFEEITDNVDSACRGIACGGEISSYDDKWNLLTASNSVRAKGNHKWKEIKPRNADSANSTNQSVYDYWLEGTSFRYVDGEPNTITLAGGINKLCATLVAGQSATLDLETNSVTIDGTASDDRAGDYTIRFSKAEDYNTFHDTVISGTSGGADTILTKTENEITVQTYANTVISVSTEENDIETASTKVKLTDGSAQIRVDEGGTINVYADLDGDGSYTDAVQPVDTELKETDAEQITISKKPSIKKPAAAKGKITVKWKHFKHTSKKTKPIWKKIKKVQIQCATDKGFTNIVKTATVGKSKTKATIKGLSKRTVYYVRVRYYDGTGYSKWSSVKKIKTK